MNFVSAESISKQISIMDIADEFGVELESISSGNFDHRCRCPSQDHKNGGEKTPSLYIDSVNNSFYCFGCHAGNTAVNFYMICSGLGFLDAMNLLKDRVDLSIVDVEKKKENNFEILLAISFLFREAISNYPEDFTWIKSIMKKTDKFLLDLKIDDLDRSNKLKLKITEALRKRYEDK
jgi:DNA primase